ncbi:hypothetical protein FOL47_008387 [Perkinsus chesapeaki]|uniref:Uncharacterized protein n=1 Tax=Perkinsus chesapeaki TaxID=330153 RepID=A0A7J6LED1_PERCH|nr:hypothetical protein FOL47_008387 [Perkinsus chesapeaki]
MSRKLALANNGKAKGHVKGQRFQPLYEFEGSPFLAIACPVLHLGMNLVKALLQPDAEDRWEAAGLGATTATIIRLWGDIRHLVYADHSSEDEDDDTKWIDKVEVHLNRLSEVVSKDCLPLTLSLHVTLHHLLDSLRQLDIAGISAWSVTEESIESLHGQYPWRDSQRWAYPCPLGTGMFWWG